MSTKPLDRIFENVATAISSQGVRLGFAIRMSDRTLLVDPITTMPSHSREFVAWACKHGIDDIFAHADPKSIATYVRTRAKSHKVLLIDRPGLHVIEQKKTKTLSHLFIFGGEVYVLSGPKPKRKVVVSGAAAMVPTSAGNPMAVHELLKRLCAEHPKVLVTTCAALSAPLRRVCAEPSTTLVLTGPSSTVKSGVQRAIMATMGPPDLVGSNGTKGGIEEALEDHPDLPVFIDDAQPGRDTFDLARLLMVAGNNAARRRSRHFSAAPEPRPIEATPIISSNDWLKRHVGGEVPGQVKARAFELSSEGGMCSRSSDIKEFASQIYGTILSNYGCDTMARWLSGIQTNRHRIAEIRQSKTAELEGLIAAAAEWDGDDPVHQRVLQRLAFMAFCGYVALRTRFWEVSKNQIVAAFGTAFREFLDREPPPEAVRDAELCDEVAAMIEQNRARFIGLDRFHDPDPPANLLGYLDDCGGRPCFLFIAPLFRRTVEEKLGPNVYEALQRGGFLLASKGRGYRLQKRVPGTKGKRIKDFIAIAADIRSRPRD